MKPGNRAQRRHPSTKHVSIDIETMGRGTGAAVVALGAVRFNPGTGDLGDEFYAAISLESCLRAGLHVDAETIDWWMGQPEEARAALYPEDRMELREALVGFANWMPSNPKGVWGNGVGFDNVILRGAFQACRLRCPWHYRDDRDMRTLQDAAPVTTFLQVPEGEVKHNALHDARHQARIIAWHWQKVREGSK